MALYNTTKFTAAPVSFNRNGEPNLNFATNASVIYATLVPFTPTIDLGTTTNRFRDIFVNNTIHTANLAATSVTTNTLNATNIIGGFVPNATLVPLATNSYDLGSSSAKWKDLYWAGIAYGGGLDLTATATTQTILPKVGSTYDLGSNAVRWNNIWCDGNMYMDDASLAGTLTVAGGYIDFSTATNIRIGDSGTMPNNSIGLNNIVIGQGAAQLTTLGSRNVVLGGAALQNNVSSNNHVAVGAFAAYRTTGAASVFVGYRAGYGDAGTCTGDYNLGIGMDSLLAYSTGSRNVCVGRLSGAAITTGSDNVIVGDSAYATVLTTGSQNTIVGNNTTPTIDTTGAISIGYNNTIQNTGCIVIGNSKTTIANDSYYIGNSSGTLVTGNLQLQGSGVLGMTGQVLIGNNVGGLSGTTNTIIGTNAGVALTTGAGNVIIGANVVATTLSTGSSNVIIGTSITTNGAAYNNQVVIGSGHVVNHGACIILAGSAVTTANSNRLYIGSAGVPLWTSTNGPVAGAAIALPATPEAYLHVYVNGALRYLPIYK